jgi:hypothetical protein
MIAPKDVEGVIEEGRRIVTPAISEVVEWLAGDECHELDGATLATELGRRLRAIGLPLDHLGCICGRSIRRFVVAQSHGRLTDRCRSLTGSMA